MASFYPGTIVVIDPVTLAEVQTYTDPLLTIALDVAVAQSGDIFVAAGARILKYAVATQSWSV